MIADDFTAIAADTSENAGEFGYPQDRSQLAFTWERGDLGAAFITNYIGSHDLERMPEEVDEEFRRPKDQWWLAFEPIHQTVSLYGTPMTVPLPVIYA